MNPRTTFASIALAAACLGMSVSVAPAGATPATRKASRQARKERARVKSARKTTRRNRK